VFGQVICFLLFSDKAFYRQAAFNYEFHFLDDTAIFTSGYSSYFLGKNDTNFSIIHNILLASGSLK